MNQLVLNGSLKDFFRELLGQVIARQRVTLQEITEFYVVNLLSEFASAEKLFTQDLEGRKETEALAILYARALQQDRDERVRTLRRLGDQSLYTAGFFPQSLQDRVVGSSYYMQMGRVAYGQVADLSAGSAFAEVYRELCAKFDDVVEVLGEMAARGLCNQGARGQMRVFECWLRSQDGRLEEVLVDNGLLPSRRLPQS